MSLKSFSFSQQSRLTEKSSFTKVFAKPAYANKTAYFSVLAIKTDQEQARLGIVVAKRYVKLAVARNKLKRLIRESFRQQQQVLSGLDVVVIVKKNFDTVANERQKLPEIFDGLGVKHAKCYKA